MSCGDSGSSWNVPLRNLDKLLPIMFYRPPRRLFGGGLRYDELNEELEDAFGELGDERGELGGIGSSLAARAELTAATFT